jgi:uracil-DNA glycosylase
MLYQVNADWRKLLITKYTKELMGIINNIMPQKAVLCPTYNNIFNAFRLTPLEDCKIIIIGQDPYHTTEENIDGFQRRVDHGLAFSSIGKEIPPSLHNIYKCLINNNLLEDVPRGSDLTMWATQGILLLNMSLTTVIGKPNHHTRLWGSYMENIIKDICTYKHARGEKLTFLLWGRRAQNLSNVIGDNHITLECIHPNPTAQNQVSDDKKFINCNHFTQLTNKHNILWDPEVKPHFFVDGSCTIKSPRQGGWSVYIKDCKYSGTLIYDTLYDIDLDDVKCVKTNQRGEGLAILAALEFILENNIMHPVWICSDSQFYIKTITEYMYLWYKIDPEFRERSNGSPIKNRDIIRRLYTAYESVKKRINIQLIHVHSHRSPPIDTSSYEHYLWYGNKIADKYAKAGQKLKEKLIIKIND